MLISGTVDEELVPRNGSLFVFFGVTSGFAQVMLRRKENDMQRVLLCSVPTQIAFQPPEQTPQSAVR